MDIAIVAAKQTPMGAFQGALAEVTAPELVACAIEAALQKTRLRPEQVDCVRVDLGSRVRRRRVRPEPATADLLEDRLGQDRPCGVRVAEEEDIVGRIGRHRCPRWLLRVVITTAITTGA